MATQHLHGGRIRSVYREWAERQEIPIIEGHYIEDLRTLPLAEWEETGGRGCLVHHEATEKSNNCYLGEIRPGGQWNPQQHLFEILIYVLEGRGATALWTAAGGEHMFEWNTGSLFAIPLNVRYQHFNHQSQSPARFLAVTNAPQVMNLFENIDFVMHNPYVFAERFSGEIPFEQTGTLEGMVWDTNLVPDLRNFSLLDYQERGPGSKNIKFRLAKNTMQAHVSEFPVGTYKKAHRHGPGAHVVILGGQGFSLMWPENEEPTRYDWHEGSLIIPPDMWFHQHFNLSPHPARYLALKHLNSRRGVRNGLPLSSISLRQGGDQIDFEDENPAIRTRYAAELERSGIALHMP